MKKRKVHLESIYKNIYEELSNRRKKRNCKRISKPEIHRRNTGYAVDILLKSGFLMEEPTINLGNCLWC
jgi:hypothetical protein